MAFGLKYTHEFKQIKDYDFTGWKIEIFQDGYGGSVTEIEKVKANSIIMSREGSLLEIVQATKLKLGIFNQTEGQYDEFRKAVFGRYKLVLTQTSGGGDKVLFIGYNQSEIYTEPYEQPPYVSVLEFTCGLSHLKHVRFDDSGVLYTGQKTIIEVLRLCLNKLPEPINIIESVNVYEDSINSGTQSSMLSQIFVNPVVYKEVENDDDSESEVGFFCNRVIEEILKPFNANIFIWNGVWHIIRPAEYFETTLNYREFLPEVGNESDTGSTFASYTDIDRDITGCTNEPDELILVSDASELSVVPPLNRIKLTYNQDNLEMTDNDLLKNGCFDNYNTVAPNKYFPDFWTLTGNDATTYSALSAHPEGNYMSFDPATQFSASNFNSGIYIEQSIPSIPVSTLDTLQFGLDVIVRFNVQAATTPSSNSNAVTSFLRNNFFLRYIVEVQVGSYYLSGDETAGFSWTLTPSTATFEKIGFEMAPIVIGQASSTLSRFSFSQKLPSLPENGIRNFRLRIYQPYHNIELYDTSDPNWNLDISLLQQRCLKLLYLPSDLTSTQSYTLYAKIDEDREEEDIEVIHGDGINTVTLNSYRLANGSITESWARRGVTESEPILEILMDNMRVMRGGFRNNLSTLLIGEIEMYNTININYDLAESYYIENYVYMVEKGEFQCNLVQLVDTEELQNFDTNTDVSLIPDFTTDPSTNPIPFNIKSKLINVATPISGNQQLMNNYN